MSTANYPKKGLEFFRQRALLDKEVGDRIIAWNRRSSAKAEARIDRLCEAFRRLTARLRRRR